jgi:gamma-glutamyltranspeptidase/glutathione hydrolase
MKIAAIAAAALLAAMPLAAGSVAVAQHAALATASPYATQAGLDIMKRGGNAIDAAVAVAFALAVAYPESGNLGGGGFLVYYEAASHSVWTLDFREVAPGAATRDMFSGKSPHEGAIAAGVPGTVAGLAAMHERFGNVAWKDLVAPAIRLATAGVRMGRKSKFVPDVNDPFVQKELAATLQRISDKGRAGFYDGELAARIVDDIRAGGGVISLRDLREYKPVWRAPIKVTYREYDIYTLAPPSAAGLMLGEELNILSGFDLKSSGFATPRTIHLIAEASRRAAIDRDRYIGDPAALRTPYRDLLSVERANHWRESIDPLRATPTMTLGEAAPTATASAHTTHFSVVDAAGNIAAVTTSLGDEFGSGFVTRGFLLNDSMQDFATKDPSPNVIASGRRMMSSASPTIILRRGQPYLVLGTSGGQAIPNLVLQVFLDVALYGKSLADAVAAPRFDQQAAPEDITYESLKMPKDTATKLRGIGHGMRESEALGDMHALMIEPQRITAVSDPRHGGSAGGF